jgi:hypothetical protein
MLFMMPPCIYLFFSFFPLFLMLLGELYVNDETLKLFDVTRLIFCFLFTENSPFYEFFFSSSTTLFCCRSNAIYVNFNFIFNYIFSFSLPHFPSLSPSLPRSLLTPVTSQACIYTFRSTTSNPLPSIIFIFL